MSMQWQTCANCSHSYEYYQQRRIVPVCPRCGGSPAGDYRPLTSDEYYRGMGLDVSSAIIPTNTSIYQNDS